MITVPDIIVKPFADSGDVQIPPQTSAGGFVNFTDGYTSFYEISLTANNPQAKAVERQVQNYMFNALTKNAKAWQSAGLPAWYAAMPNGYSANAWVLRQGGDGVWRPFRAVVDGTSADPLTSTDWEYVQLSSEMIKNIPMPAGGLRGPTTALITVATDFDTFRNGTWQIINDTIAGACPHVPVFPNQESAASAGMIEAITWSNGSQLVTIQRYTNRNGAVATRSGLNGSFSPWVYQLSYLAFQNGYGVLAITNGTISPTVNVYVANTLPTFGGLSDGCEIRTTWGAGTPANTGPSTFNLNGTGAFNILAVNALPLQGGEILPGGGMTLRFRTGVGWMVMSIWQGNFPVMQATQSRHATPFAQVQSMIDAAKITQVDWSNVVNKPNVAIQSTSPVFTSMSLVNQSTPFIDFYYGNQSAAVDARIIAGGANTLSVFVNVTNAPYRTLYMDAAQFLVGPMIRGSNGMSVPAGVNLMWTTSDFARPLYVTNHDANNLVFYSYNDAVTVSSPLIQFNRATSQATLWARPTWVGLTPWDTGNFNPALYRAISNNTFTTQLQIQAGIQFIPGSAIYWTNAGNSIIRFYTDIDDNAWRLNARGDDTDRNAFTITRATAQVTFGVRPSFAGQTPWDTGNFNPASYVVLGALNNNYTSLSYGQLPGIAVTTPGAVATLNLSNAANQSASTSILFERAGSFACYFGLDTDNVLKVGGYSMGQVAYPILTTQNLATYLPGALAAIGTGGIGSYGLFTAYALASPNAPGGTVAGASIRYSATDGYSQAQAASGTWRMMGMIADADGQSPNSVTLYQRIA